VNITKGESMKITKSQQLKEIIKEELGLLKEGAEELEATGLDEFAPYNFEIYYSDHLSGRKQSTAYYLINVPFSMLDTEKYEEYKETHGRPERFLKINPELLEKSGYRYGAGTMDYRYVEEIPDTIPVTVQKPPTIVDASTL